LHGGVCLSAPPFRAEHIGSLLRPREILEGRAPIDSSRKPFAAESLGLQVVTDGEFRRESWRLGSFARSKASCAPTRSAMWTCSATTQAMSPRIGARPSPPRGGLAAGKVRRTGPIVADEVALLSSSCKNDSQGHMPAPSSCITRAARPASIRCLSGPGGIFRRLGRRICAGLRALDAVGGRYLQIDEVAQPLLCDENLREAVRARATIPTG